jgi:AraC family transcriptional regulator, transcriptional activator FtrA
MKRTIKISVAWTIHKFRLDGIHLPRVQEWPAHALEAQFSCKLLAMRFGISPRQLERVFRAQFNASPKLWLRQERMKMAVDLLQHGHAVKCVAADLHFRGADTFCRAFKNYFGQKPDEFRYTLGDVASGKSNRVEPRV